MRRSALRVFFERVVVATLPLAGCGGDAPADANDLAVADLAGDAATGSDDGALPGDWCELIHPPFDVRPDPDAGLTPDGGVTEYGSTCYYQTVCLQVCVKPGYAVCCGPVRPDGGGDSYWSCYYDCGPGGRRPAGM